MGGKVAKACLQGVWGARACLLMPVCLLAAHPAFLGRFPWGSVMAGASVAAVAIAAVLMLRK
jgi:hypothetical protein